jgi:peptidoglycan/LPS O-acetylase OafA/YrhL
VKLLQLQALRGLAATLVVLFHAQSVCPALAGAPSVSAALMGDFGRYGVDLFFVLSGFIIRYAEPAGGYVARDFFWRRVRRVVPIYWLLTLVAVGLGMGLSGSPDPELGHALRSFGFVSFLEGRQPLLYVGWSLEFEMFFYVTAAVLLLWRRDPWRELVIGFSALSAVGSALDLAQVTAHAHLREFFLDPLLLEFALGVELARLFRSGRFDVRIMSALVLAFVVTLVARWDQGGGRVVVAGLPAALLLAGAVALEKHGKSLFPAFLTRLGDASYSLYLVQVFTLSMFAKLGRFVLGEGSTEALVLVATLGTVVAGFVLHHVVEVPLGRMVSRRGRSESFAQVEAAG